MIYLGPYVALTSLGNLESTWQGIQKGASGLKPNHLGYAAAHIPDEELGSPMGWPERGTAASTETAKGRESVYGNRFYRLAHRALSALNERLTDGFEGLRAPVQLILSTTKGEVADLLHYVRNPLQETGNAPPEWAYPYAQAQRLSEEFGFTPEPVVVANACIAGMSAVQVAQMLFETRPEAEYLVLLGAERADPFLIAGFSGLQCLSPCGCRPYDSEHDGMSLGDAAAAVLLCRAPWEEPVTGAGPTTICSVVTRNDGYHLSSPLPEGNQLVGAISESLQQAGLQAEDIAWVNGHGTGTTLNDAMEARALHRASLGERPVNGFKGSLGHTLGAAGAIELLLCSEQLQRGELLPTVGMRTQQAVQGPEGELPPLQIVTEAMPLDGLATGRTERGDGERPNDGGRHVLKVASGFGGTNAAMVVSYYPASSALPTLAVGERMCENGVTVARCCTLSGNNGDGQLEDLIREAPAGLRKRLRRMSPLSQWVSLCAYGLLGDPAGEDHPFRGMGTEPRERIGVVLSSQAGTLMTDLSHARRVADPAGLGASPAEFLYTVGNAPIAEICIQHDMHGENIYLVEPAENGFYLRYAEWLIHSGRCDRVVAGWANHDAHEYDIRMGLLVKGTEGWSPQIFNRERNSIIKSRITTHL